MFQAVRLPFKSHQTLPSLRVLLKSDGLLDLACETRLFGGHLNSVVSSKQFGMGVNKLERDHVQCCHPGVHLLHTNRHFPHLTADASAAGSR